MRIIIRFSTHSPTAPQLIGTLYSTIARVHHGIITLAEAALRYSTPRRSGALIRVSRELRELEDRRNRLWEEYVSASKAVDRIKGN